MTSTSAIRHQLAAARLLPVLTVHSEQQAVDLCEALIQGGVNAVEVTLRTPQAADAIAAIRQEMPQLSIAAGTVTTTSQMEKVAELGVSMAVSPGLTQRLSECARQLALPFLPGVSTASEIMRGMELGYDTFKFFPAESSGGVALLKALAAPFGDIMFCPTGGIDQRNLHSYLALPNVICVGGSWMVDSGIVARQDWRMLTADVARMMTMANEMRP